jgi:hypothetical protein
MPKVAYLTGASGSWKSYIAQRLQVDARVIEVDRLRDKTESQLLVHYSRFPDEWRRCDNLLRSKKAPSELSAVLAGLQPPLSDERPLLAEGISLGHDGWRKAFRTALVCQGITIIDERVFWIDPPAKVLWNNRQGRGREDQRDETLETVREHRDYYAERLSHDLMSRHEDRGEAIRAIREFLLS